MKNNRHSWVEISNFLGDLVPIHAWHLIVNENQVNRVLFEELECLVAVGCSEDGISVLLQSCLDHIQYKFVIIDAEQHSIHDLVTKGGLRKYHVGIVYRCREQNCAKLHMFV